MKIVIAVALMGLSGCSSSTEATGPCGQRSGTYRSIHAERDGTCGAIPEQIAIVEAQPTAPEAPCTGSISYSKDNCRVTYNSTCPADGVGSGHSAETRGLATWTPDGWRGTSTMQLVVRRPGGAVLCQSTYDVTMTKL